MLIIVIDSKLFKLSCDWVCLGERQALSPGYLVTSSFFLFLFIRMGKFARQNWEKCSMNWNDSGEDFCDVWFNFDLWCLSNDHFELIMRMVFTIYCCLANISDYLFRFYHLLIFLFVCLHRVYIVSLLSFEDPIDIGYFWSSFSFNNNFQILNKLHELVVRKFDHRVEFFLANLPIPSSYVKIVSSNYIKAQQ